jgi:CBS domain-containing protein
LFRIRLQPDAPPALLKQKPSIVLDPVPDSDLDEKAVFYPYPAEDLGNDPVLAILTIDPSTIAGEIQRMVVAPPATAISERRSPKSRLIAWFLMGYQSFRCQAGRSGPECLPRCSACFDGSFARPLVLVYVHEDGAIVVSTVRRSAEQTLRPLEDQLHERRQRGQAGAWHEAEGQQAGKVADVMSTNVRLASPEDTVQQAARLMREEDTEGAGGDDARGALRVRRRGSGPCRREHGRAAGPPHAGGQPRRAAGRHRLADISRQARVPHLAGRALRGITRPGRMHNQSAAAE